MAIHANYEKIKDYRDVCYIVGENNEILTDPVLESICLLSHVFGMQNLNEKNIEEWGFRLKFYQKLFGNLLYNEKEQIELTMSMIEKFFGLTTNCVQTTRHQFVKQMAKSFDFDYRRELTFARKRKENGNEESNRA